MGPSRMIFYPTPTEILGSLDSRVVEELYSSPLGVEVDLEPCLEYLPEMEAEVIFFLVTKGKSQKEISKLLKVPQPTISYRYRRALNKISYILMLKELDLRRIIDALDFLRPGEKDILFDLFWYTNQERVGQRHRVRQSSVKWIFSKTYRRVKERERKDPEKWYLAYTAMRLLDRFIGIRIIN